MITTSINQVRNQQVLNKHSYPIDQNMITNNPKDHFKDVNHNVRIGVNERLNGIGHLFKL